MVTVISGANSENLEGVVGQTVGAVRQALAGIINIAPDATATLNGSRASNDDVLEDGDELVFSRATAQKG